jgi:hypothetical protein
VSGGFKRSSWFGLIGVFVVAALVIVIAAVYGAIRAIGPGYPATPGFDYRLRDWTVLSTSEVIVAEPAASATGSVTFGWLSS